MGTPRRKPGRAPTGREEVKFPVAKLALKRAGMGEGERMARKRIVAELAWWDFNSGWVLK